LDQVKVDNQNNRFDVANGPFEVSQMLVNLQYHAKLVEVGDVVLLNLQQFANAECDQDLTLYFVIVVHCEVLGVLVQKLVG